MQSLSLKLKEPVFVEMEQIIGHLKKNRNAYINEAVAYFNKIQERQMLAIELEQEAILAAESSMEILTEFEAMNDPIPE